MNAPRNCQNCNSPLAHGAAYCSSCGQSVKDYARPWSVFLRDAFSELFDLDGRMLTTLRLLLTRPGFLSREYFDGRRKAYSSPLRLYLVISLLFFLALPLILQQFLISNPDHAVPVDVYSQAMFLLLPYFALLLKLLYRKVYYLLHLVFSVHTFSAMFIAFALLLSIETLADRYLAVIVLQLLLFAYVLAYGVIALRTAYGEGWGASILKFLLLLLGFLPVLGIFIELPAHLGLD